MEFNFAEIKEIAETLPIGYYAKRRIAVGFDKDAQTSYYSQLEDKIVFAYNNIVDALNSAEGMDKETAIRSVLYHEVSHAILTPTFYNGITDDINIFEDERIETLLKDYYMDTDFNGLLHAISPYDGSPIKSPMEAFFVLCRHRIGKKPFLEKVEQIIKNYAFLSASSGKNDTITNAYYWDIKTLYAMVQKDFQNNPDDYENGNFENLKGIDEILKSSSNITDIQAFDEDKEIGISVDFKQSIDASKENKTSKEIHDKIDGQKSSGNFEENEGEKNSEAGNGEDSEKAENNEAKDGNREENEMGGRGGLGDRLFSTAIGHFVDTSLTEKLTNIISIFNKKNNSGNGAIGHSGILNPRNCGRDDYRFFDRKLEARGNNRFGSLHLNLFIDTSGSFYKNKEIVNKLITALVTIERKNKNFSVDIVHCECGEKLTDKTNCLINPWGGNYVDDNFGKIFRSLQKSNTYNYNIILFDGWCCPANENVFCSVDTCNTTIISDSDNKSIFDKMRNAKVIITKEYVEELYGHVFTALQRAFR